MKTLYKKNKNGSYQQWVIYNLGPNIIIEYGQVAGRIQTTSKLATPKNVGRSNETTPDEQAFIEVQSMWKKKLDSGYAESIAEADNVPILPMLALNYTDHKDKIDWTQPNYIQPKFDGVRCIARWVDNEVKLFSRKNKEWTNLGHITKLLKPILPKDMIFDGEIYLHGLTFQEISSLTKKYRSIETLELGDVHTTDLHYHIYDGFILNKKSASFSTRKELLSKHITTRDGVLIKVDTYKVNNQQKVDQWHTTYINAKFEGIIFRVGSAPYTIGHRSSNLLKIKTFMDAEFEIVDYFEGIGRFKGAVTWVCKLNNSGKTVDCVPKGTMKQKRHWFTHGDDYIGKLLKIKFFGYTDEGSLRFPVGLGIRLDED